MNDESVWDNFVINGDVIGVLDALSSLRSMLNFEFIASTMLAEGGPVSKVCDFGAILLFLMLLIKCVQTLIDKGFEFNFSDYVGLLGKTFIIYIFFCLMYRDVCWLGVKFAESMTDIIDLSSFRTSLRNLVACMQMPPLAGDDDWNLNKWDYGGRAVGYILNKVSILKTGLIGLVNTILMLLFLSLVLVYLTIGPFILLLALFMGPICMAMSLVFSGIGRSWANLFLGGVFFSFVTMLGLMVLVSSGFLALYTYSITMNQVFQVTAYVILGCTYLTLVPFMIGQLFNCSAFSFVGRMLGWLYGLTWFLSPLVIMSELANSAVGDRFSAKSSGSGKKKGKSSK